MITYSKFSSRISFFEFLQEEFHKPHFKPEEYAKELRVLEQTLSTDLLVRELETMPKIIDIAEEFFQLKRFTNTQYTHFLFDVSKFNSPDLSAVVRYADTSVHFFENKKPNQLFQDLFNKSVSSDDVEEKVMCLKRAAVNYINEILKNKKQRKFLYEHISNSVGTRYRIATYLIENLHADKHFTATNLHNFLALKRVPRDGKGIHGKYGSVKIKEIFKAHSIQCSNEHFNEKSIPLSGSHINIAGWSYISEKMIQGVNKRKDGKLKKFDFILLKDGDPMFCIETNFYSTTGTKIGINIGEYTDLNDDIKKLNKESGTNLKFIWVTDGNHWLSLEGENNFKGLKERYFTEDWEMLNYNLFSENLRTILSL